MPSNESSFGFRRELKQVRQSVTVMACATLGGAAIQMCLLLAMRASGTTLNVVGALFLVQSATILGTGIRWFLSARALRSLRAHYWHGFDDSPDSMREFSAEADSILSHRYTIVGFVALYAQLALALGVMLYSPTSDERLLYRTHDALREIEVTMKEAWYSKSQIEDMGAWLDDIEKDLQKLDSKRVPEVVATLRSIAKKARELPTIGTNCTELLDELKTVRRQVEALLSDG